MRRLVTPALALVLCGATAAAQLLPDPPAPSHPKDLALPSVLYDAWLARGESPAQLQARFDPRQLQIDGLGRVNVMIAGPRGSAAISDAWLATQGAQLSLRSGRLTEAWMPVGNLTQAVRSLPEGYTLKHVNQPETFGVAGEGPAATGSASWRDAGADGTGIKIAVLDLGWAGLDQAIANGDAPSSFTAINYNPNAPFQSGSSTHGTSCLETIFDHAPGATYRLYRVVTDGGIASAVEDCIDEGVDVISCSLGFHNESWEDDEGHACDAANDAAAAGIVFVTAAGNEARNHWQGNFNGGVGSPQWHDWYLNDEALHIDVEPGESIKFYLCWDDSPSGSEDYDLYLMNETLTGILASSTSANEFYEDLVWTNTSSTQATVAVGVWRASGASTDIELFANGGTWEYFTTASSTTAPINASHYNVISVGAVKWSDFDSPMGASGILTDYSSWGPTNGGKVVPDMVGPTETTTFTNSGPFGGTSCAAPNVVGMIACLWSSTPGYRGDALTYLSQTHASFLRDWGAAGHDQGYGRGGANLVPFAPNTRWVSNGYTNPTGASWGPTNTLEHAVAQTPLGGRVVFLPGGVYPQAPITLTKLLTFVSYGADAVCGD